MYYQVHNKNLQIDSKLHRSPNLLRSSQCFASHHSVLILRFGANSAFLVLLSTGTAAAASSVHEGAG